MKINILVAPLLSALLLAMPWASQGSEGSASKTEPWDERAGDALGASSPARSTSLIDGKSPASMAADPAAEKRAWKTTAATGSLHAGKEAKAAADATGGLHVGKEAKAAASCAPQCFAAYAKAFDLLAMDRPIEAASLLRGTIPTIDEPLLLSSATTLLDLAEARAARMAEYPRGILESRIRDGRFPFIAWSTIGSIVGGTMMGAALDLPDARSNVLMVMGITGTGLAASILGSREASITPATASLYATGLAVGGFSAWNLAHMLEASNKSTAGAGIAGLAVGGALGYLAGSAWEPTPETSTLIASALAWGTASGMLLLPAFGLESRLARHGTMLGGSVLGMTLGTVAARRVEISRTRIFFSNLGALVGGLGLGGLGIAILDDRPAALIPRVVPAMTIAGIIGGGSLALLLTRDMDDGATTAEHTLFTQGALLEIRDGNIGAGMPRLYFLPMSRGLAGVGVTIIAGEI